MLEQRIVAALKSQLMCLQQRRKELEASLPGLDLMGLRNKRMITEESIAHGRAFKPAPADVFAVTYPKCGTTWMQQIMHMLRSGGDMDFGEVTEVVPWDCIALDCGQNLNDAQQYAPRCYKSHESYEGIGKGGKYIYVARDPRDAFVSFFNFLPAYMGIDNTDCQAISMDAFAEAIFAGVSHSGLIWNHFLSFWKVREQENVLWIFFEDMKDDLRSCVKKVGEFMGLTGGQLSDTVLDTVCHKASYKFMSLPENKHHFDSHFDFDALKVQMGLEIDAVNMATKVYKGKVGGRASIPPHILARLDECWGKIIEVETGLGSYEELRASLSPLSR
jgi:aryl sulfotransferase